MPGFFYDIEKTGLFPKNASPIDFEAFSKSRLVSIAWCLRDDKNVYSERYYIVKKERWRNRC